jgi:hypothetical protein
MEYRHVARFPGSRILNVGKAMKILIILIISILVGSSAIGQPIQESNSDPITIGLVKKHIHIGSTKQEDVISTFGSPNNIILRDGRELWIYDRMKVETNSNTNSSFASILILGAKNSNTSTSTVVRNITVMIEFDKNGIVEDLRVRTGGY